MRVASHLMVYSFPQACGSTHQVEILPSLPPPVPYTHQSIHNKITGNKAPTININYTRGLDKEGKKHD